jgi:hypothetical protein
VAGRSSGNAGGDGAGRCDYEVLRMRVLVMCEKSGRVREAFAERGHDAWSNDILPTEIPGKHIQGDGFSVLKDRWDLLIAFYPCTYMCSSGLHWNYKVPGRSLLTEFSLGQVGEILDAPIPKISLENPIGCISTRIRKPDQIIQPYQFGEDASKKTCLWLKNLPPLYPTKEVAPRIINGRPRWANQTDSGQNRLGPSETRATDRARTYPGIATAMAEQWG